MDIQNTLPENEKEQASPEKPTSSTSSVIVDANDDEVMEKAGEIIRNGGLVSFPTETVYGLGANALDETAATSIFTTKERPMTDPLIVHIYKKEDAYELIDESEEILEVFNLLADKFWPGPFTCVMKANYSKISPVITAATGYVGVRCPNHPVALRLIKEAQRPIAAPSANKFGHVSPTKAEHVLNDFINNKVYILDGGSCDIGIESTVVKLVREEEEDPEDPEAIHIKLWILRRGGLSEKAFNSALSEFKFKNEKIKLSVECVKKKHYAEESHKMEAPGQFLRHYAPNLPSYMLTADEIGEDEGKPLDLSSCVVLDFNQQNKHLKEKVSLYLDLSERGDYIEAINRIYDYLRVSETQEEGEMVIIADLSNAAPLDTEDDTTHSEHSSALFDRLFRAVTGQAIKVDSTFSKYAITKL